MAVATLGAVVVDLVSDFVDSSVMIVVIGERC
jgi:hypothetical protein